MKKNRKRIGVTIAVILLLVLIAIPITIHIATPKNDLSIGDVSENNISENNDEPGSAPASDEEKTDQTTDVEMNGQSIKIFAPDNEEIKEEEVLPVIENAAAVYEKTMFSQNGSRTEGTFHYYSLGEDRVYLYEQTEDLSEGPTLMLLSVPAGGVEQTENKAVSSNSNYMFSGISSGFGGKVSIDNQSTKPLSATITLPKISDLKLPSDINGTKAIPYIYSGFSGGRALNSYQYETDMGVLFNSYYQLWRPFMMVLGKKGDNSVMQVSQFVEGYDQASGPVKNINGYLPSDDKTTRTIDIEIYPKNTTGIGTEGSILLKMEGIAKYETAMGEEGEKPTKLTTVMETGTSATGQINTPYIYEINNYKLLCTLAYVSGNDIKGDEGGLYTVYSNIKVGGKTVPLSRMQLEQEHADFPEVKEGSVKIVIDRQADQIN